MPDVDLAAFADVASSRSVDRRTLLLGVAGALASAGLVQPVRSAGRPPSLPGPASRA